MWGAALSVVEVDVLSGSFRILESKLVQDCGKSLNPHLDIGQAEGGFMFGVGYYLMEEMIYSDGGQLISDNVSGYKIPSCGDVPLDWDIELLNYRPTIESGIHSSKGIRESNLQLALSVYFAVKDAVAAARVEMGMNPVFELGFPASVDRVESASPKSSSTTPADGRSSLLPAGCELLVCIPQSVEMLGLVNLGVVARMSRCAT